MTHIIVIDNINISLGYINIYGPLGPYLDMNSADWSWVKLEKILKLQY